MNHSRNMYMQVKYVYIHMHIFSPFFINKEDAQFSVICFSFFLLRIDLSDLSLSVHRELSYSSASAECTI